MLIVSMQSKMIIFPKQKTLKLAKRCLIIWMAKIEQKARQKVFFSRKGEVQIMKAVLMAAGVGSRLGRAVTKPKCVLDVDGIPLIRRTVEMLLKHNISVAVVVGYKYEFIYKALEGLDVKYYFNPFYKVTNSMASLWFARNFIDDKEDMILGNADVFWGEDILNLLLSDQRNAVMLSDVTRVDIGDYFFKTDNAGRIVAYGKDLARGNRDCEYVGLAKLKAEFLADFKKNMDQCVDNEMYDLWWENVLYEFSMEYPIHALDVDGRFWSEIDYVQDYERIIEYINSKISSEV